MIIANMASYPLRESTTLENSVVSIAAQVDVLNLCLNEFIELPRFVAELGNVNAFIPDVDYKDVGKFIDEPEKNDDVFYVDDDIIYPRDYVQYSSSVYREHAALNPIVGLHGVIYSDVFDGLAGARNVFAFNKQLNSHRLVNQLGTGTVHCKGWQCPTLDFMLGSERFVDVRFAVHCFEHNMPMICMARRANWLQEQEAGDSIFEGFTKRWPLSVVREVQGIAGYGRLSLDAVARVEKAGV